MAANKSNQDLKLVKDLAKVLDQSDLTEIEMRKGDLKIRVSKGGNAPAPIYASAPAAAPAAPVAAQVTATATAPAASVPQPEAKADHPDAMKSPMVGTCYLRPSPDADMFAEIGDSVKEGETIMLVEAMKTFNPIVAAKSGTLKEVFVEDGAPVEFGDALFLID